MRMIVNFENPPEPFNTLVKKGTAGATIKKIMEAIKPEAVYFSARNGNRGGTMIVDLPDASYIPKSPSICSLHSNRKWSSFPA